MPDSAVAHFPSSAPQLPKTATTEQAQAVITAPLPTSQEQSAPADLVALPRGWERFVWYTGAALISCVLIFAGLRLDQVDLKAPFYYDLDSLLILPMVKSTVERGFGGHWRTERLGAPGILELHDYPVIDHLHFFLIWLLGKVVPNVILLYNLYFLLTFPLTTFTAMIAFRQLRLTLPAAAVGGLLYSFLPFHYQRWENHYFLAAYWMVPLSLIPALSICKGELPFFRKPTGACYQFRLVSWVSLGYAILALAIASGGAYYAFFTCAFIAFAALYSFVVLRKFQAFISALALIALIVAFGVANHLPTLYYQSEYGRNPVTDRSPGDADRFGLKIAHLILPIEDHNLRIFVRYKWYYNSPDRPVENENRSAALGIIGVVGLFGLVISLLLPYRIGWPYGAVAGMTVFGILLGTIGGFGSVFNLIVTAQIRSYNRISVFIAFLCYFATLWAIDRFLVERRRPLRVLYLTYAFIPFVWLVLLPSMLISRRLKERVNRLRIRLRERTVPAKWLIWSLVLIICFLDQTPHSWFTTSVVKTIEEQAARFQADNRFFADIERMMPAGSKIFCLPYVQYPESPAVHKMQNYEHVRGYIHTESLLWSYGAMKGREVDAWQLDVSFRDTEELLQRIVYRGFDGLLIDKRGFPTQKDTNEAFEKITKINKIYSNLVEQRNPKTRNARLPEKVHEDGQQFFIDLRPYREELKQVNPQNYDAKVKEEQEWVAVIWLEGFFIPERPGELSYTRFGPPEADMWVINPSDRARKFQVSMGFHSHGYGVFRMQLSGLVDDDFNIERKSLDKDLRKDVVDKKYNIEVPPGRHRIHFICTPPPQYIPDDSRRLCYYLTDYKFEEQH